MSRSSPGEEKLLEEFERKQRQQQRSSDRPKRGHPWLRKIGCPWKRGTWIRLAVIVTLAIVVIVVLSVFNKEISEFLAEDGPLSKFIKQNLAVGAVVFSLAYVLCTVLFLPASPFTVLAGFLFDYGIAFLLVIVGATVGATLAFLIARFFLRDWVHRKVDQVRVFKAIDQAIGNRGLYLCFLLRLSPVIPFNLLNYALGVTPLRLWQYVVASLFGIMPGTAVYVFIGFGTRSVAAGVAPQDELEQQQQTGRTVLIVFGVLATIGAIVLITLAARHEMRKLLARETGATDLEEADDQD